MRAAILYLCVTALLGGCARTTYVPVETVRTQWRDREVERVVADTVSDTRVVWIKGDTVIDYRDRERIHRVEVHDTCMVERTDTIRIPYPVEKPLTRWQQAKMDLGGAAMGGSLCLAAIAVVWLIRRLRGKR